MILILSTQKDVSTDKVCNWLLHYNIPFLRINENVNAVEKIFISNKGYEIVINYNNKKYNLHDFRIIWYRRGFFTTALPELDSLNIQKQKVLQTVNSHLVEERQTMQNYLYESLADQYIINDPRHYNANKLIALKRAIESGLKIPDTYIVKNISVVPKKPEDLVTKNIQDVLSYFDEEIAFGHTTKEVKEFDRLNEHFFYSLFQEKIEKKYEIRSFVFFDKIFSMAIFSQNNAKTSTDFRNYDREKPNRMLPFKLPDKVETQIQNFMAKMNLESGSIDFIYNGKEFVFLEVNPVGQFDFVSVSCNYGIEKHIAKKLQQKYQEIYLS